jgi:hypothetical protein
MQKVPGVTEVKVSLNEGLTIIDFAPDNKVTLPQLRQVIRNNGFVTNQSRIVARGALVNADGAATFEIRGSNERLRLTTPVKGGSAGDVVVTGDAITKNPKAITMAIIKFETP